MALSAIRGYIMPLRFKYVVRFHPGTNI